MTSWAGETAAPQKNSCSQRKFVGYGRWAQSDEKSVQLFTPVQYRSRRIGAAAVTKPSLVSSAATPGLFGAPRGSQLDSSNSHLSNPSTIRYVRRRSSPYHAIGPRNSDSSISVPASKS